MQIQANGALTIPLYHGTSSIFLQSIRLNGLEARTPAAQSPVLDLFKKLFRLAERQFGNGGPDDWMRNHLVWRAMADQRVTSGGFNFRHNGVFLTCAQAKAIDYAVANRCGGELASNATLIKDLLDSVDPILLESLKCDPAWISILRKGEPILVEATEVPLDLLVLENGQPVGELIEKMSSIDGSLSVVRDQLMNFRADYISTRHLRFYRIIDSTISPGNRLELC